MGINKGKNSLFCFFWFFGLFKPKNQNRLSLPLFTPKNAIFGLFKPKIFKNFLHILKVEKIPKKSRVQALKSDKNSRSYEGKYTMHFFYGFWGDFAHIGKSFRNPLRSCLKHKNPNSQLSRPQIKISPLHPPQRTFWTFQISEGLAQTLTVTSV